MNPDGVNMKIDIRLFEVDGTLPCYCQYSGQTSPQDAYVELYFVSDTPILFASYNSEIGNAIPMYLYHGHAFRWWISNCLTGDQINDLMKEVEPFAEQLAILYYSEWDGSNNVGRSHNQEKTNELSTEIQDICKSYESIINVYTIDEYFEWESLYNFIVENNLIYKDFEEILDYICSDALTNDCYIDDDAGAIIELLQSDLEDDLYYYKEDADSYKGEIPVSFLKRLV